MAYYDESLKSERLKTRVLCKEDALQWSEFFKDSEAINFVPVSIGMSPLETAQLWVDKQLQRYEEHRYGLHVILNKETGEFLGLCGLLTQTVDGIEELEVGYHMLKKHWGKGYAPEAAQLFVDYAVGNRLSESIISIIDVNNKNSQRVAEKNGFVREKETHWGDFHVYIYRIVTNGRE